MQAAQTAPRCGAEGRGGVKAFWEGNQSPWMDRAHGNRKRLSCVTDSSVEKGPEVGHSVGFGLRVGPNAIRSIQFGRCSGGDPEMVSEGVQVSVCVRLRGGSTRRKAVRALVFGFGRAHVSVMIRVVATDHRTNVQAMLARNRCRLFAASPFGSSWHVNPSTQAARVPLGGTRGFFAALAACRHVESGGRFADLRPDLRASCLAA